MPIQPNLGSEISDLNVLYNAELADPSLYGWRTYNFTALKYPEDLGHNNMAGHYINFFINVHESSMYFNKESGEYRYPAQWDSGNPTSLTIPRNYVATNVPTGGSSQTEFPDAGMGVNFQKSMYRRINQAISLYIPDSMNYSQNIQWENSSIQELGGKLARGAGNIAGAVSGASSAAKGVLNSAMRTLSGVADIAESSKLAGFALNPQLLVLFRGIDFRSFSYDFFFTPRNTTEAASVRNIIRAFRFHSHPEAEMLGGVFYTAPSTFDIEYMHVVNVTNPFEGKVSSVPYGMRNTNINQVKNCILKNYSIDYGPFGWSTYKDGMPVQTRLSLQFQEVELLTKRDIERGF